MWLFQEGLKIHQIKYLLIDLVTSGLNYITGQNHHSIKTKLYLIKSLAQNRRRCPLLHVQLISDDKSVQTMELRPTSRKCVMRGSLEYHYLKATCKRGADERCIVKSQPRVGIHYCCFLNCHHFIYRRHDHIMKKMRKI